ncbi:CHAD domain-containing protein [Chitinophaga dinghuensis]|uniref:CHAD domain-containing protein n=1 Tax=Chitinophaga dinghuensis TaxID=1539050 RepID=A0A327W2C2_9BACT|nr:CHAD domain-containing protein [Chitinophaga dinghuensis]RAJ83399.1 CHAD domain-containing protein [Chitinophaga dinghuensis]
MIKATLFDYLQTECTALTAAHDKLLIHPRNPAAVHEQRVGVKKLRAFFALTDQIPHLSFKHGRYLNKLRVLQSIAGIARDAQLQARALGIIEKREKWRFAYAHMILQERQEVAAELLTTASKRLKPGTLKELPNLFRQKLEKVPETRLMADLLEYINDQYREIASPGMRAGHAAWHEVRKQMKAIYYQLSILKPILPADPQYKQMQTFTKRGGELLGNWHDLNELHLFTQNTIRKAKKESLQVPVKALLLLKTLKQNAQEELALSAAYLHKK